MTSEEVKISGYDASKVGEQTVTIIYIGKTLSFKINIVGKDQIVEVPDTMKISSLIFKIFSIILIVTGTIICTIFSRKKRLN